MVHVNSIRFPFHPVLGVLIPILIISGNLSFDFLIFKSLNITLVGGPSFLVGVGMGSVTYYLLEFFEEIFFFNYITYTNGL